MINSMLETLVYLKKFFAGNSNLKSNQTFTRTTLFDIHRIPDFYLLFEYSESNFFFNSTGIQQMQSMFPSFASRS